MAVPSMLRKRGPVTEKQSKWLTILEESGEKMLKMITRPLDLSKMENSIYRFNPEPVNLVAVIDTIINELQKEIERKSLSVLIQLNGKPIEKSDSLTIFGEELLCYTMLDNLIINAVEASSKGEKIAVLLGQDETTDIIIHNQAAVPINIRDKFFEKYITSGKKE